MSTQVSAVSTSKEMEIFNHKQFGNVRVILDKDNNPWFVAKDVCDAIELNTEQIRRLDDDEKADLRLMQTSSNGVKQARKVSIISESGMYCLVMRSNKPEAKKFRKWVTSEVLPSIRKTGSYSVNNTIDLKQLSKDLGVDKLKTTLDEYAVKLEVLEKEKRAEQKRAHTVMGKLGATTRERNKFEKKVKVTTRKLNNAIETIEVLEEEVDTWKGRAYRMKKQRNEAIDKSLGLYNENTFETESNLQ